MSKPGKVGFVAPVRLSKLAWLPIALGALWAGYHYGTPHLRVVYVWSGTRAHPTYHECQYWGLHPFKVRPLYGECPIIVLARPGKEL